MLFCSDQSELEQKNQQNWSSKHYFHSQTVCNASQTWRMPLTSTYKDISNSLGKCKRTPKSRTAGVSC